MFYDLLSPLSAILSTTEYLEERLSSSEDEPAMKREEVAKMMSLLHKTARHAVELIQIARKTFGHDLPSNTEVHEYLREKIADMSPEQKHVIQVIIHDVRNPIANTHAGLQFLSERFHALDATQRSQFVDEMKMVRWLLASSKRAMDYTLDAIRASRDLPPAEQA